MAYLSRCREAALFAAGVDGWQVVPCAENGEPLPVQTITEKLIALLPEENK